MREFEKDYSRTVAYCFIYAVVTAGQIEMTNERMRDLILGIGGPRRPGDPGQRRAGGAPGLSCRRAEGPE